MSSGLVPAAALAIVGAIGLGLALLMGHGAWLTLQQRRRAERMALAKDVLHRVLLRETPIGHDSVAALRALPRHAQDRLILDLTRSVAGSLRSRTQSLAAELGVTRRARRRLRSWFWWRRLRGARILAAAGGTESEVVPLLLDRHPAVRDQAIQWAGDCASPRVARALVGLLASPVGGSRYALHDALLRLGRAAVEPLAEELATASGERLLSVLRVAADLPHPRYVDAALALCAHPDALVRAYAATVLGATGGKQPVSVLRRLLHDPDPRVRARAATALARIGDWPTAPEIARLLEDPSWDVRRASALALRDLGSPGRLLLRRARENPDPFAADMAVYVLALDAQPELAT